MVHARAKKAKGDDAFTAKKQKIGRKKLAPVTATRAEVHAATLRIQSRATPTAGTAPTASATVVAEGNDATNAAAATTSKKKQGILAFKASAPAQHSFGEDMVASRHYKESVRKSSFESMHDAFRRGELGPVQKLQLVVAALDTLTDTDVGVRHEAARVLLAVLSVTEPDGSIAARMLDSCRIALTHASGGVRKCGSEVLLSLVKNWPGLTRLLLLPEEAAKMLNWATDVAIGHVGSLPTVEALCSELLLGSVSSSLVSSSASLGVTTTSVKPLFIIGGDVLLSFYDKIAPWLSTMWKESVELQAALFRSSETVAKALSAAKILSLLSCALQQQGILSKAHKKRLRDLFLTRVPISMREMSSSHNENARSLALAIAEGCVPIATLYDDAYRTISTFVTVTISSSSSSNSASSCATLVAVEALVLRVISSQPQIAVKLIGTVPALMNLVIRSTSNLGSSQGVGAQSSSSLVFELAAQILLNCCALEAYSHEGLTYLSAAIELTPRFLFGARRLPPADADRIASTTLRLLWNVFASCHPVVKLVDRSSLEAKLQSIFGFQRTTSEGQVEEVPGILAWSSEPSTAKSTCVLAKHLFHYIKATQPPQVA